MELVILTTLVALAITILAFTNYKRKSGREPNLPPGSFGWPIIGETLEFLFGKPEKFVGDRMKKYSPNIFKTKILGEKVAVLCGPAGNKFIFSNEQKLVTSWRPHSTQKLMRSYQSGAAPPPPPTPDNPKEHDTKVLRQPGFFKPEALARFLGKMDSITQEHIKLHWEGNQNVEVFPLSKMFTLTLASYFFLGLANGHDRITKLVKEFDDVSLGLHCIPINFPGTIFYHAKKGAAAITKEIQSIVREKKVALSNGTKTQDILTHMILVSDPNGRFLPEVEIADKFMGLLSAGYSTVASAITFLMKYVGENQDIYNKILSEQLEIAKSKKPGELLNWEDLQKMKYSWNVACEVMRLVPPLQGTFREAITDITYEGFTIPKGWKMYWTVSTTSKNPDYFPNPEEFNPTRYNEGNGFVPFTYVPFGGGPRHCPGKEYARLAILCFLHNIVKGSKWELMIPDEKIMGDMIPTPAQGVPIRLIPHSA